MEQLTPMPELGALYRRAVAGAVTAALPGRDGAAGVPDVVLRAEEVRADADRLARYQHLLGEPGTDVLPAGFVHVLAFPLAMAVMVREDFPLPVLGMVHVANRVVQHRPLTLGEPLSLTARAEGLRPHRRGTQVDLVATASVDGEPVWEGTSTYLAKGRGAGTPSPSAQATGDEAGAEASGATAERPDGPPVARWRLTPATAADYARVSGDRNPIHTSRLAARAFGFPSVIAHGMDTAARALAALAAVRGPAFVWEVEFGKPVVLPATVELVTGRHGEAWRFLVRGRSGRAHLDGSVAPLR